MKKTEKKMKQNWVTTQVDRCSQIYTFVMGKIAALFPKSGPKSHIYLFENWYYYTRVLFESPCTRKIYKFDSKWPHSLSNPSKSKFGLVTFNYFTRHFLWLQRTQNCVCLGCRGKFKWRMANTILLGLINATYKHDLKRLVYNHKVQVKYY